MKVSHFLSLIAVTFASAEISEGSSPLPVALKTFQIYHALKPNTFTPRGTIEISYDGEGSLVSTFQTDESNSLDDEVLEGLDAIVSNNGFYRIKVEDKDSGAAVIASVPACDVRRANLRYVSNDLLASYAHLRLNTAFLTYLLLKYIEYVAFNYIIGNKSASLWETLALSFHFHTSLLYHHLQRNATN